MATLPLAINPSAGAPLGGLNTEQCYQCGKCTAGCPMAEHMDLMPNQIMRLVQLGQLDKAMRREAIWQCVSCQTCIDALPEVGGLARGDGRAAAAFGRAGGRLARPSSARSCSRRRFCDNIRRNGRLNELELIGVVQDPRVPQRSERSRSCSRTPLLAPKMMQRGKFHLQRREGARPRRGATGSSNAAAWRPAEVNDGDRLLSRLRAARLVERLRDSRCGPAWQRWASGSANWTTGSAAGRRPPTR